MSESEIIEEILSLGADKAGQLCAMALIATRNDKPKTHPKVIAAFVAALDEPVAGRIYHRLQFRFPDQPAPGKLQSAAMPKPVAFDRNRYPLGIGDAVNVPCNVLGSDATQQGKRVLLQMTYPWEGTSERGEFRVSESQLVYDPRAEPAPFEDEVG